MDSDVASKFIVGTSGWHYNHWRDRFYPTGLPKSKWLKFYSQYFRTVEINASFYRLPTENAFTNWQASTPVGFVFAVKGSRLITHYRRLIDVEEALTTFLGRARLLEEKLGPILYQLPPGFHRNDERLDSFLSLLPQDLKHVMEFRHPSWLVDPVFDILRKHNVAFCIVSIPDFNCPVVATADFSYVRLHGSQRKYTSCYSDRELDQWAAHMRHLSKESDTVYAYFNNDAEAHAVHNALTLMQKLGVIREAPDFASHA